MMTWALRPHGVRTRGKKKPARLLRGLLGLGWLFCLLFGSGFVGGSLLSQPGS